MAIQNFPQPRNITDVHSWFGLVNQAAHYDQLTALLAPFRSLLSPKSRFEWTPDLDASFRQSKQAIIEAIENGVEIFDPQLTTCPQTDYSCRGIGYWLRQKYCSCEGDTSTCCPDGGASCWPDRASCEMLNHDMHPLRVSAWRRLGHWKTCAGSLWAVRTWWWRQIINHWSRS